MSISDHNKDRKLAVIVAAAGSGRRFGGDKMSATMGETTVLEASVDRLREALPGAPVFVVVGPSETERWRAKLAVDGVIAGGARRQDSVRIGVEKAVEKGAEIVAIHDGARPVVHPDDVRRVIDFLGDSDAAILAAPVTDTVKRTDTGGLVTETLDRDRLWLAQTPQVVRVAAIEAAWRRSDFARDWSDEAALIESDGGEVRSVAADHANPKITTAADLELVRALIGDGS